MRSLPRTAEPREWVTDDRAPLLSPDQRRGLRRATWDLHKRLWDVTGTAIDMNTCETLAAWTIVSYHHAVTDTDDGGQR